MQLGLPPYLGSECRRCRVWEVVNSTHTSFQSFVCKGRYVLMGLPNLILRFLGPPNVKPLAETQRSFVRTVPKRAVSLSPPDSRQPEIRETRSHIQNGLGGNLPETAPRGRLINNEKKPCLVGVLPFAQLFAQLKDPLYLSCPRCETHSIGSVPAILSPTINRVPPDDFEPFIECDFGPFVTTPPACAKE
jgi:hypothetical protein